MNEVRQVWTSIRSSRSCRSSIAESFEQRTTWYDAPAPEIVHSQVFSYDKTMDSELLSGSRQEKKSTDEEEVLYQNNVEAALNSLSKVCAAPLKTEIELESDVATVERRRHSSSIELTATSSMKVGEDGMPQISFSFLGVDESPSRAPDLVVTRGKEVADPEETLKTIGQNELYDFPKSVTQAAASPQEIKIQISTVKEKVSEVLVESGEAEVAQDEWYDVPKSVREGVVTPSPSRHVERNDVPSPSSPRSSRLLEDSEVEFSSSGIRDSVLSNSGSCSDVESIDGSPDGQRNAREKRLKRQRRRLGKAWGKMRSWLKEEKIKLGEVVAKHAKLQAVGAMSQETSSDFDGAAKLRNQSGSYDLTRPQKKFDAGSVARVEEFGLSSVSEEALASDTDGPQDDVDEEESRPKSGAENNRSSSKNAGEISEEENGPGMARISVLKNKTKSSENIMTTGAKLRFTPVSFSLDKLCSDGENEEKNVTSESEVSKEQTTPNSSKGAGLIKRRMLGSIRGLMASTHLLQVHEIEEVMGLRTIVNLRVGTNEFILFTTRGPA